MLCVLCPTLCLMPSPTLCVKLFPHTVRACPLQVLQLRADLSMLQATNNQANALAAAEVDTALSSVSGDGGQEWMGH